MTVVQPNEDGSYWRKIVRNKMVRMKEQRRVKAAKKWIAEHGGRGEGGRGPLVVGPVHVDHRPGVQEERPLAPGGDDPPDGLDQDARDEVSVLTSS